MIKFLNRYNSVMAFEVYQAKGMVKAQIISRAKNPIIGDDLIQVSISPSFFDPFAPDGYVNFRFTEISDPERTNLRCEVYATPVSKSAAITLALLLGSWSVVGMLFRPTFNTLLKILVGWGMMTLFFHWHQILNQGKLENYVHYALGNMKRVRVNST